MCKRTLLAVALLASLATAREARAWGAYHAGYTYHSPSGGFTPSGTTAAYGPYGEHTSTHSTSYSPNSGFSHTGYGQTSGAYGSSAHYSTGSSSSYGGYHSSYGGYSAGAYRRW